MTTSEKLSIFYIDVLQEISNIGAGNAATALSKLLNRRVDMNVPKAGIMPFNEIFNLVGSEEEVVSCVNFDIKGDIDSCILFLLTEESSFALIDLMLGKSVGTTGELDDFGRSVLQEIGNILCGSFLTALSEVTKLNFNPSVPAFAFDMLGAVLSGAFLEGGYFEDQALIIETQFFQEDIKINGHFFLVPEPKCLNVIFRSLGLDLDGGM